MKIGELARCANCRPMTIRYYEKIGLMPDLQRNGANYRVYGQEDLERLRFIIHCRNQQLPLQDIHTLLKIKDNGGVDEAEIIGVIERHAQRIREKIAELGAISNRLDNLLTDKGSKGHRAHIGRHLLDILSAPCPECPDFGENKPTGAAMNLGKVSR